jgi:hypothetical protein
MIKKLVIIMNVWCTLLMLNGMKLNKDEEQPSVTIEIPELKLDNLHKSQLISSSGPKTPISGVSEIGNLVKARSVLRQKTARKEDLSIRGKILVGNDEINMNNVKGLEELGLEQKKLNSIEEAKNWGHLKTFNATLYDFAQSHDMSFEDATIYADLLQRFHLAPEAVVEQIKQTNKLGSLKPDAWEIKHYEKIQQKDPAKYEEVMLNFMKEIFDKEDGKSQRSTIHSEHLTAQSNQIAGQNGFIQKLTVGSVVGAISTIVMGAWAVYGQIYSSLPANQKNCTM